VDDRRGRARNGTSAGARTPSMKKPGCRGWRPGWRTWAKARCLHHAGQRIPARERDHRTRRVWVSSSAAPARRRAAPAQPSPRFRSDHQSDAVAGATPDRWRRSRSRRTFARKASKPGNGRPPRTDRVVPSVKNPVLVCLGVGSRAVVQDHAHCAPTSGSPRAARQNAATQHRRRCQQPSIRRQTSVPRRHPRQVRRLPRLPDRRKAVFRARHQGRHPPRPPAAGRPKTETLTLLAPVLAGWRQSGRPQASWSLGTRPRTV